MPPASAPSWTTRPPRSSGISRPSPAPTRPSPTGTPPPVATSSAPQAPSAGTSLSTRTSPSARAIASSSASKLSTSPITPIGAPRPTTSAAPPPSAASPAPAPCASSSSASSTSSKLDPPRSAPPPVERSAGSATPAVMPPATQIICVHPPLSLAFSSRHKFGDTPARRSGRASAPPRPHSCWRPHHPRQLPIRSSFRRLQVGRRARANPPGGRRRPRRLHPRGRRHH